MQILASVSAALSRFANEIEAEYRLRMQTKRNQIDGSFSETAMMKPTHVAPRASREMNPELHGACRNASVIRSTQSRTSKVTALNDCTGKQYVIKSGAFKRQFHTNVETQTIVKTTLQTT